MTRVAVLDDYQGVALSLADWRTVTDQAEVVVFSDHVADVRELAGRLAEFDIIVLMRERTPVGEELLGLLPKVRLIVTTGRANASIDLAAATARGVRVACTNAHETDTALMVELTWTLILASVRGLAREAGAVRGGGWQRGLGSGLTGRRLGLVGLGRIGSEVARIGTAFGMNVSAWSPNLTQEKAAPVHVRAVGKETLLRHSDIVSLHLRLSERSKGVIAAPELALMKSTAFLVNTARGPLVDEKDLVDALTARRIAGAALDVFDREPLPADHPFRTLDNVLATPHIGYVAEENYHVFFADIVADIAAFLAGRPIRLLN
jgi:phosphoglycerate dehydrogenase-like enzyme